MLLTVDIGTSTFKTALWDYDGKRKSFSSFHLDFNAGEGDRHEAEPSKWLDAFFECTKKLGKMDDVQALVISGNGPSLVPVTGEPEFNNNLYIPSQKARLWLDRRAMKYSEEVSELMGGYVDASFFLPKILYIKNEEYDLYKNVKTFIGCPEYLAYALTGQARTVFPCEGFDRWFWNDEILNKLDLDPSKFPPMIHPGDVFAAVSDKASERFGFKKNIPVISGGPDFYAAILGSGVLKPGQLCNRTGSSDGINLCTEKKVINESFMSYSHPVQPYWNLSGMINTTGRALEWGKDILGLNSISELFALSEQSKYGSEGLIFHPFLKGERAPAWKSNSSAAWNGINLNTGKREFANSILEGIGFAIKDIINAMEESGEKTEKIFVTGGLAGFNRLNQIKADITGKEIITCLCKETELLGLAVIGSCFLGKYKSFTEAIGAMCRSEKCFTPDLNNNALYNKLFFEYKNIKDKKS